MYKYELHCHTSEGSKCGAAPAAEIVDFYKRCGFAGIVITDHFFNGNCTVPKDLDWKERVRLYCKGYENAKKRGDEIGIDVFFGWEFGGDFVTLGLSPEWLESYEDLDKLEPNDYFDEIHKAGGYVIHAHPFRERPYIKYISLFPRKVDAVETINVANAPFENSIADYYADKYGLIKVAGTDRHSAAISNTAAVETKRKAESLDDLITIIKNNEHSIEEYSLSEEDGKIILKPITSSSE